MSGPTKGNGKPVTDSENDDAVRFRRPRRPVEVRRRAPWKRLLRNTGRVTLLVALLVLLGGVGFLAYSFATTGSLFTVQSLEAVRVTGNERVPARAVRERFTPDRGGSVFAVPLAARRRSLEEIPWVQVAVVQRVLPNGLWVHLRERTPVAFLRRGASLWLIDAEGVILPLPEGASFAFPVVTGLPEGLSPEERRSRMGLYMEFVRDLAEGEQDYSSRLSEVDLSNPENLQATVAEEDGAVWLLFGRERYREKFEAYLNHRSFWQKSGDEVRAVDLRYRGQIVLNPEGSVRAAEPNR